jgi:dipeptidyl aminopeptidase/acylaminoacyl peptidase
VVVVDGTSGEAFDAVAEGTLRFSPDGKRVAYAAGREKQWCVVVDGKAGAWYPQIGQIAFSPDSKTIAYVARRPDEQMVVVGEKPQRAFDRVGDGTLVFSSGGRRLAYVARSGRASFVVVDGKRKPRFDLVGCVTFAPDGRSPVYAALRDKKAFCVVEDKPSRETFDAVWLAPGERIPFDSPKKFHYLAVRNREIYLVEEELE